MPSYSGSCTCGAVAFEVEFPDKPIFNMFCHCRACSRARGTSPSHLLAVQASQFSVTKGESNLKVGKGTKIVHAFCTECGCHIYQCPDGAGFRAVFPVNFHIENETDDPNVPCGISSKLPDELIPNKHVNYENRVMDVHDDLPKFTAFSSSPRLNNDGTKYEE